MMLALQISDRIRGKAALGLLALALMVRLLVPAGWMPVGATGYAITLCTGMGTVDAWVDADGTVHKNKPVERKADQPCVFAGFAAAIELPSLGGLLALPALATLALVIVPLVPVAIGRGLVAPPPPPTGPPATL